MNKTFEKKNHFEQVHWIPQVHILSRNCEAAQFDWKMIWKFICQFSWKKSGSEKQRIKPPLKINF